MRARSIAQAGAPIGPVVYCRAMRIKELSLLGFKSFATRTRLVFPGGITAIVGPNGSGKSNVADAVRWVLGEGRSSTLRARSADEMIFAGTERRARGGLAEVTLVIDNADGGLELDYAEVAITRRVQRDGNSSFFINDARVRRQDVLDLIGGALGQGDYTVIGQGLVDSFLSMRPEQRRSLIDEAAGIAPLQRRADRTLRKLAESEENLTRVRDVLAEIEPRMRKMARLAERASKHKGLADELAGHLTTWYGHRYHRERSILAAARRTEAELRTTLTAAQKRAAGAEAIVNEAAGKDETVEKQLETIRARRDELVAGSAEIRQSVAVERTRLDAMRARRAELERSEEAPEGEQPPEGGPERLRATLDEALEVRDASLAEYRAAQAKLEALEKLSVTRATDLERLRAEEMALSASVAAHGARIDGLLAVRATRAAERVEIAERASKASERIPAARTALDESKAKRGQSLQALEDAREAVTESESSLREAQAAMADAREAHAEARAGRLALSARAEALSSVFDRLDAPADLIDLVKGSGNAEVLGTIAQLIQVDPEWETAVAVALGPLSSAVVVRDRASLTGALNAIGGKEGAEIALIVADGGDKSGEGARSSGAFLAPSDVVRPADGAPEIIQAAIGSVGFVEDLADAFLTLDMKNGPDSVVTRSGVKLDRRGAVIVGGGTRELLSLARERRELPRLITAADEKERAAAENVEAQLKTRAGSEARLTELVESRAAAEQANLSRSAELDQARELHERAVREHEWSTEALERLEQAISGLEEQFATLEETANADAVRNTTSHERISAAKAAVDEIDVAAERPQVDAAGARAAGLAQRVAGLEAELAAAERDAASASARRALDIERKKSLDVQIEASLALIKGKTGQTLEQDKALTDVQAELAKREVEVRSGREVQRERSAELEEVRRKVAQITSRQADAQLQVSRAEDRLERLAEQLSADGEIVELPPGAIEQLTIVEAVEDDGTDGDESMPPAIVELPDGLERRIASLRRELRQIGAIDLEALAAYEDTERHHAELQVQLTDLEAAKKDLRAALETLDTQMRERFDITFEIVSKAFHEAFPKLFGGGEASLQIQSDEDGGSGIEIIARPPGKRPQPLALLSGGERAITAVALVFALLQASGTPFVVLDEVDAALDEANVDRFRSAIRELAEDVQIVIITHNRATVESADTVYGVTMNDDGASRTVSLRVEEAA